MASRSYAVCDCAVLNRSTDGSCLQSSDSITNPCAGSGLHPNALHLAELKKGCSWFCLVARARLRGGAGPLPGPLPRFLELNSTRPRRCARRCRHPIGPPHPPGRLLRQMRRVPQAIVKWQTVGPGPASGYRPTVEDFVCGLEGGVRALDPVLEMRSSGANNRRLPIGVSRRRPQSFQVDRTNQWSERFRSGPADRIREWCRSRLHQTGSGRFQGDRSAASG